MVLLSISKKLNQWLGPFLLRQGIKARYAAAGGILRDNRLADSICFLPIAQKLIQVEVHDEAKAQVAAALKQTVEDKEAATTVTRLRVLESYLRPALVKNERWSDVRKWQFHSRIVKWARTEFLLAKYGAAIRSTLDTFPAIHKSPQLNGSLQQRGGGNMMAGKLPFDLFGNDDDSKDEREGGTMKLPYSTLLTKAFGMSDWKKTKDLRAARSNMTRIAQQLGGTVLEMRGGSVSFAHIPDDDADLSELSLEQILELAGGHVMQCGPLNALCEDAGIYQFWTREYVDHFGRYLLQRAAAAKETVILDVGAGDGLLSQLLRDFFQSERDRATVKDTPLQSRSSRWLKGVRPPQRKAAASAPLKNIPTIIASDNGTWGISPIANVERLSVQEAIDANTGNDDKQIIVICSWMPMNEDWSASFRYGHVDEYILIGECDDGQCGDNWETWGNPRHLADDFDDDALSESSLSAATGYDSSSTTETPTQSKTLPPYLRDGYERRDLDELSPYQFSRFDCRSSKSGKTVSFRRRQASC